MGAKFRAYTDHKPLVGIIKNSKVKLSARLECLSWKLQQYNFNLFYQKGADNPTDYLSRHPEAGHTKVNAAECSVNFLQETRLPKAMTLQEIIHASNKDPIFIILKEALQSRVKAECQFKSQELRPFANVKGELLVTQNGIILRGERIVIPKALRNKTIELAHEGHQGIVKTKALIRTKVWFPGIDNAVEKIIEGCIPCLAATNSKTRNPLQM